MLEFNEMILKALTIAFAVSAPATVWAAMASVLGHPAQDIRRMFPESSRYVVRDLIPIRHAKKDLLKRVIEDIGETIADIDQEYDTLETPRTFYAVYQGDRYIGLVHGVNVRLDRGPMQVFVAYEKKGKIRDVYLQKMSFKDAPMFRAKTYSDQFRRYGLGQRFEGIHLKPPVRNPTEEILKVHHAVVRAVRMNMAYVKFLYNEFNE
ncbi:MAG: hypothetical protein AB1540_13215 [Bdellovibrionota bacterium]